MVYPDPVVLHTVYLSWRSLICVRRVLKSKISLPVRALDDTRYIILRSIQSICFCDLKNDIAWYIHELTLQPRACAIYEIRPKMHLNLNSREITCAYKHMCRLLNRLEISHTVMLCADFQNDLTTEMNVPDDGDWDVTLRWISWGGDGGGWGGWWRRGGGYGPLKWVFVKL